jgi:hypothetical protein
VVQAISNEVVLYGGSGGGSQADCVETIATAWIIAASRNRKMPRRIVSEGTSRRMSADCGKRRPSELVKKNVSSRQRRPLKRPPTRLSFNSGFYNLARRPRSKARPTTWNRDDETNS